MNDAAKTLIEKLKLSKHPEGGYYKEVYRSDEKIKANCLPLRFKGERNFSTSIYFLLEGKDVSHFHRIQSDEIWHFYEGSTLLIHQIDESGNYHQTKLGKNLLNNEVHQCIIHFGVWFAAEIVDKNSYALVGCTVAPGFDFKDFELAEKESLVVEFPQHSEIIKRLTL